MRPAGVEEIEPPVGPKPAQAEGLVSCRCLSEWFSDIKRHSYDQLITDSIALRATIDIQFTTRLTVRFLPHDAMLARVLHMALCLSVSVTSNCTWCVLFIAFMFIYRIYSCHVSTVLCHITVLWAPLSARILAWCSSSMREINWSRCSIKASGRIELFW